MTLVKNVGKFVTFTEVTLLNRKPCLGDLQMSSVTWHGGHVCNTLGVISCFLIGRRDFLCILRW